MGESSRKSGTHINFKLEANVSLPAAVLCALSPPSEDDSLSGLAVTKRKRNEAKTPCKVEFEFVNFGHPSDAKGLSAKRMIRSHVARVQHSKGQLSSRSTKPPGQDGRRNRKLHPKKEESPVEVIQPPRLDEGVRPKPFLQTLHQRHGNLTPPPAVRASMLSDMLNGVQSDPLWTYPPVPNDPYIEMIVDHYLVNVAVDIPDIDSPTANGLVRTSWFPLCITEPATFYAVMLMAASHHSAIEASSAYSIDLLVLRGRAIGAINQALADPQRATSDSLIGAVMKMAAYEACFGEPAMFKAHMAGLQRMIVMRGGIQALGTNHLLERMVLWIDCNAAHLLGTPWSFRLNAFPATVMHPLTDSGHSSDSSNAYEDSDYNDASPMSGF